MADAAPTPWNVLGSRRLVSLPQWLGSRNLRVKRPRRQLITVAAIVPNGLKVSSCDLLAPARTPLTLHGAPSSLTDHQHKMTYAILPKMVVCTARG
jgi:hypothetical protein